jgi:hypothetical protein
MRFENLKFQEITYTMNQQDKDAALRERWDWFNNCAEELSIEKKAILKACLQYAQEAFNSSILKGANAGRYEDFNAIFKKIIHSENEDTETFLLHMEAEVKIMRHKHGAGRLPDMVKEVLDNSLLHIISQKLNDQQSDIYKGMIGMRDFVRVTGGSMSAIVLWNADYGFGIGLAVATGLLDLYLRYRYKDEAANRASWLVYQNTTIRENMVKAYNWTPTNWPSLFSHAKTTITNRLQHATIGNEAAAPNVQTDNVAVARR